MDSNRINELISFSVKDIKEFYQTVVNNMTPGERREAIKNLIYKSCLNCTNSSCRVDSSEKLGSDKNGKPMGNDCIGWKNDEYVGRSVILQKNDVRDIR